MCLGKQEFLCSPVPRCREDPGPGPLLRATAAPSTLSNGKMSPVTYRDLSLGGELEPDGPRERRRV